MISIPISDSYNAGYLCYTETIVIKISSIRRMRQEVCFLIKTQTLLMNQSCVKIKNSDRITY